MKIYKALICSCLLLSIAIIHQTKQDIKKIDIEMANSQKIISEIENNNLMFKQRITNPIKYLAETNTTYNSCKPIEETTATQTSIDTILTTETIANTVETEQINSNEDIYIPTETYELYDENNSFKSYMDYSAITNISSDQYELQQCCWTDDQGLRRYNDYYCVALGTYYCSSVGQTFRIYLDNGNSFDAIIADIKDNRHTDETNRFIPRDDNSINIIEFIVETNKLHNDVLTSGNIGTYNNFEGNIVKIERTES